MGKTGKKGKAGDGSETTPDAGFEKSKSKTGSGGDGGSKSSDRKS